MRIGIYADLSASGALDGTEAVHGAELRVAQANASGGAGGREVELVSVDVRQSPADAVKAYSQLAQAEAVCAVIGGMPAAGMSVSAVADLARVPLVHLSMDDRQALPDLVVDSPDRTGTVRPFSFMVPATAVQESSALAAFAAARFPVSRYATLFDPVSPVSILQARAFESAVRHRGRQVAASVAMTDGGLDTAVSALRKSGAEAVYICASVEADAAAAKAVRSALPTVLLLGNRAWGTPLAPPAGLAAWDAWFCVPYSTDDRALRDLSSSFTKRFGVSFLPSAAAAWDAVGVILAAVRKAGTSDPVRVRDALEQAKGFKVLLGTLDMDPRTHRPLAPVVAIMRILDGAYRTEDPRYVLRAPPSPRP